MEAVTALQCELDTLLDEDLASVRDREQNAFDRLIAPFQNRLVLFGAGNLGQTALRCLHSAGIEPLAFSDNKAALWGSSVSGVTVLSPEDAAERFGDSAAFFVTIWSHGHTFCGTRDQLGSLGCRNVFPAATLRWKFAHMLLPFFCQDLPSKVYEQASEVKKAAVLWADERSLEQYKSQVRWRALGEHSGFGRRDKAEQYFPEEIFSLLPEEEFVDCGAYVGDTLRILIARQQNKVMRAIAIEPDPVNYAELARFTSGLDVKGITIHNVALGRSRTRVQFNSRGTPASSVASNGEISVDCVPLDELLHDSRPTYLKMDIEGSEEDAILGACRTIQRDSPVLAVCMYHKQKDLWSLPLLIREVRPDYRFFLLAHAEEGWETVCYAVPKERCRYA
jgi:FkbM family methyltransferase